MTDKIETPRGAVVITKGGKAQLKWNPGFGPAVSKSYSQAQKFVDSEVLRLSSPYIPLRTGMLMKSGQLGTDIGSGLVQWIAPYAAAQYYRPGKAGSITGGLRGPMWFERMKADHGKEIIAGARQRAGGWKR